MMWIASIYIYMWIFKVDRLTTLIFGRLHVYICMWILKIGRLTTLIFGRLHIYLYVCGFLKLASLSKLIFGRFFLKKIKNKKLAGSIYMSVCVCVDH